MLRASQIERATKCDKLSGLAYQILTGAPERTDGQKGIMICLCSSARLSSKNIHLWTKPSCNLYPNKKYSILS